MHESVTDKLVYVVRHGQTEGNILDAVQGSDDMLSAEGRLQADRISERAKGIDFVKRFLKGGGNY